MQTYWPLTGVELSDRDLLTIARLVYDKTGIHLHEGKRALVAARLQKRLRRGGFRTFRQYVRYVQADQSGDELTAMLDAIATNHTSFFREPRHFDYLSNVVLPPLAASGRMIRGWSAGCATGEEAYTIAIVLFERLGIGARSRVSLLASDLSTKALKTATAGVYPEARLQDVPPLLAHRYFAALRGGQRSVVAELRDLVDFRQLNLLDVDAPGPSLDFIFCRNVMIYFDRDVQQRVVRGLERRLAPGGYLFVSHSESLSSIAHGLTWVAPSVYRRVAK